MWINRKKYLKMLDEIESLNKQIANIEKIERKQSYLIDIQRVERVNKFVFVREGKFFTIETMGLISDNFRKWREELLS